MELINKEMGWESVLEFLRIYSGFAKENQEIQDKLLHFSEELISEKSNNI